MSAEEDTELRDLVAQTLETNGVLGKVRAQLRANVFLALEEQESLESKSPMLNQPLRSFLSSNNGKLTASIVCEFLEYFNLDFSLAVFEPESGFGGKHESRESLAKDMKVVENEQTRTGPLLMHLLKKHVEATEPSPKVTKPSNIAEDTQNYATIPMDFAETNVDEALRIFNLYDANHSGTIEKEELHRLLMDMFPNFNKNMLDRYVNDEFRAADRDLSNSVDFEEFLAMYKRLYTICHSVVVRDVGDSVTGPLQKSKTKPSIVEAKNKRNTEVSRDIFDDEINAVFTDPALHSEKAQPKTSANTATEKTSHIPRLSPSGGDKKLSKKDEGKPEKNVDKVGQGLGKESRIPKPSTSSDTSMTSLSGLPSLTGGSLIKGLSPFSDLNKTDRDDKLNTTAEMEDDLKDIDSRIAALGFDIPPDNDNEDVSDDYEDDFAISVHSQTHSTRSKNSHHSERKNNKSPISLSEASQSIGEEIDDDIEEDLSVSQHSAEDDITTDHTVSAAEINGDFDYIEDALST